MNKKYLKILVIGCCITFLLAGCNTKKEMNDSENTNEINDSSNVEDMVASKVEFTRGEWNGNTYENNFFNMKIEIPEDWEIKSDEDIEKQYGVLDDGKNAYLIYSLSHDGSQNLTSISEKVIDSITEDIYVQSLINQLKNLEQIQINC